MLFLSYSNFWWPSDKNLTIIIIHSLQNHPLALQPGQVQETGPMAGLSRLRRFHFVPFGEHKQKSKAASSRTAAILGLCRVLYRVLHICLQQLLSKRLRTRVLPSPCRHLHRALRVQPLGWPADLRYRWVVNSALPWLGKTETSARNKSQTCAGLLFSLSSVRGSDPFLYESQKWSKYGFFISLIYLLTSSF